MTVFSEISRLMSKSTCESRGDLPGDAGFCWKSRTSFIWYFKTRSAVTSLPTDVDFLVPHDLFVEVDQLPEELRRAEHLPAEGQELDQGPRLGRQSVEQDHQVPDLLQLGPFVRVDCALLLLVLAVQEEEVQPELHFLGFEELGLSAHLVPAEHALVDLLVQPVVARDFLDFAPKQLELEARLLFERVRVDLLLVGGLQLLVFLAKVVE